MNRPKLTLNFVSFFRSPQAYNDLRESGVCVLPTPRLLQYYKNSVDQAPGVNEQQLNWMVKEAAAKNITEFGKRGGLILDEMSIQDDIQVLLQVFACVLGGGGKYFRSRIHSNEAILW